MRPLGREEPEWDGRGHFCSFAARLMRQVLVDYARKHGAAKRARGLKISIEEIADSSPNRATDLLALDQALTELWEFDPRKSRIVELRYFAGMGVEETARAMAPRWRPFAVNCEWRKRGCTAQCAEHRRSGDAGALAHRRGSVSSRGRAAPRRTIPLTPGTNYDAIFESDNTSFAERFVGQTRSTSGNFDVLSGTPAASLAL